MDGPRGHWATRGPLAIGIAPGNLWATIYYFILITQSNVLPLELRPLCPLALMVPGHLPKKDIFSVFKANVLNIKELEKY